jgi:hypothetical protein
VPKEPFQLLNPPDSNPSENATFVYSDNAGCGDTADDADEARPVPTALIAATVKVYGVPFDSPVTVWLVAAEPVSTGACATPPTYGVNRYAVIGLPPSDAGAAQLTAAALSRAAAVTAVGIPGAAAEVGVTAAELVEPAPTPTPLIAATTNV